MRGLHIAVSAAGALLVAFVTGGAAAAPSPSAGPPEPRDVAVADPAARFVPGELVVRFREGVPASARAAALGAEGAERVRDLSLPRAVLARLLRGTGVEAAAQALSRRPDVAYAEPNWIYRPTALPNDPRFDELWGLNQASDADIDAPEAWNVTIGSASVVVAVVDTGLAYDHPDLAPNLWANPGETPANGLDDDGNGKVDDVRGWDFFDSDNDPRDTNGHGTHVAGTIGAQGSNTTGVVGVNWNVSLMPVRVLGPSGGTNAQVTDGFAYAAANGAKVVNASLGGAYSQAMKDAIDAAPGTLFVVAAANGGMDGLGDDNDSSPGLAVYPCNFTSANVVCVAATTRTDGLAEFSNYGAASVDLGAPGTEILSTWLGYDSLLPEGFETASGWVAGGSPNTWARTTETAASGNWSATDSPGGNYAANTDNWFRAPAPVDLSGRTGCHVRYALKLDTKLGQDYFVLEVSTDGSDWFYAGSTWTGQTSDFPDGWDLFEEDISLWDGTPSLHVRLGLESYAAPGPRDGVHVDDFDVRCFSTNYPADTYVSIQGTSMATPHVAGVAALAWAKNPAASVAQVKSALLNGGDAVSSLAGRTVSGRRLNAAGTLALIPGGAAPPETVVSGPAGTWARPSVSFELSSVPGGASFECRVNGGAWAPCTSPHSVTTTVPGQYVLDFRAVSATGSDATPESRELRVVRPFVDDWDGDGKADVAVWRPAAGAWYVQGAATTWFGLDGDVSAPGQWDADAPVDRAVYRPQNGGWYVEGSATIYHGTAEDVPVPADWDGDGTLEPIVWRPSHGGWYVHGIGAFYFGARGDVPVPGDYDADPQLDLAVFRPESGGWHVEGSPAVFHGLAGDIPVPADWDGDSKTDIAVYRPSNSTWYLRGISTTAFGLSGDVPLVGDFDADPEVDRAIWRPESGGWYVEGSAPVFHGLATDIP